MSDADVPGPRAGRGASGGPDAGHRTGRQPAAGRPGRGAPRVVAELGRPETPEETAARKAEASRKRRANQTVRNLVLALVASLGIVLLLVLVVPRGDGPARQTIDWEDAAAESQPAVEEPLAVPRLPPEWTANAAELEVEGDVPTWYIGFLTPSGQYIGLDQGIGADARWLDDRLADSPSTGTVEIAGTGFDEYDRRDADDPGNLAYALTTERAGATVVLFGTAPDDEFALLAASVVDALPDASEGGTR